ncbi:PaaI family thioesterase [Aliiroseovarius sp. YM-037]|uniref:PaaI family thioesterase n=1 Tax=Aliiroseovarius sp. YM-037 TaxID=3341728 RepID=UPI003A7F63E2
MELEPQSQAYERRTRENFTAQGLMRTFKAMLDDVSPGRCVISAPIEPGFSQQHGFAHAGLTFALGDSAAGFAAFTLMPEDREVLTAEIKINLIAPAKGQRLEAVGQVLKPGNRLITVESNIFAIDGSDRTHVAVMLGTMVATRPR